MCVVTESRWSAVQPILRCQIESELDEMAAYDGQHPQDGLFAHCREQLEQILRDSQPDDIAGYVTITDADNINVLRIELAFEANTGRPFRRLGSKSCDGRPSRSTWSACRRSLSVDSADSYSDRASGSCVTARLHTDHADSHSRSSLLWLSSA